MESYVAIYLVIVFLPFLVSLRGYNPVWKFLSFLFCVFSIFGIFAFVVPGVLCWIIAWIFAGVSFGSTIRTTSVDPTSVSNSKGSYSLVSISKGSYSLQRLGLTLLFLAGVIAIYSWLNSSGSVAKFTSVKVEKQSPSAMTVTSQPVVTDITGKELSNRPLPVATKAEAKRTQEVKQQKLNKPLALTPPASRADASTR